jgi:hypothetical protein
MGGAPKAPKDPNIRADRLRKEEQARTRDKFLSGQKTRSQSGRASTVLAQDEKTTVLGG